jgi:hypothetical protein
VDAKPHKLRKEWAMHCRWDEEERLLLADSIRGFYGHEARVRATLADHQIRQPVQLREAPRDQDRFMPWLEYLASQYWRHEEIVSRRHEKQKLVDGAFETIKTSIDWTSSQKNRDYLDAFSDRVLAEACSRAEVVHRIARRDLHQFECRLEARDGLEGISREAIDARLKYLRDRTSMGEGYYAIAWKPATECYAYRCRRRTEECVGG